tara:strand:+ start:59 stop:1393 length:1335 start_codon:yes stop_codon:yes gene_type:complete
MSYSNRVKIHEIEPIYDSAGNRAEFRFVPNKIYSTNVLLGNLAQTQATTSRYNRLAGIAAMFDNVMLYDGNVELQMTQLCAIWGGWKQSRKSNSNHKDKQCMIVGNSAGFRFEGEDATANQGGGRIFGRSLRNADVQTNNEIKSNTGKASLPMNELLPLLDALPYLDTSVFKDLRLIVEYNGSVAVRENKQELISTERPLLIVEEMVDPKQVSSMMGKMGQVVYDNVESDRANVPQLLPTQSSALNRSRRQPVSFHLSSYSNKKVGKMVVVKQAASGVISQVGNADYQNGVCDSQGLYKESFQVRVNGANVFPKNGITKSNQRLARCVDAWGDGGLQVFGNGLAARGADAESRQVYIEGSNASIGYMDWVGIDLGYESVRDLQIEFGRDVFYAQTGNGDGGGGTANPAQTALSKYNSEINLIIFALVRKAIIPDGKGGYDVRYL